MIPIYNKSPFMPRYHSIDDTQNNSRLDQVIGTLWEDVSRTFGKKLIQEGFVLIDGTPCTDPKRRVHAGSTIQITLPPTSNPDIKPQAMDLDIIHEDEMLLVINKPVGLVVHPGAGNWTGTLVNGLLHHCKEQLSGISGVERPGIVHRLDKDTSGLMVVAKTNEAHLKLSQQFSDRTLSRTYEAFTHGLVAPKDGVVEGNIGRHSKNRQKMAVLNHGGKTALTHYAVKQLFPIQRISHVLCTLETGRTHQIRVHMAHQGWPLLGDTLYGRTKQGRLADQVLKTLNWPQHRQALHAGKLQFNHPKTGDLVTFQAPLPQDMQELLNTLKQP